MTEMAWRDVVPLLRHPRCQGAGPIRLVAADDFYSEEILPFRIAEGGIALRVIPQPGFRQEHLAGGWDERLLIVDCPDGDGWLVPDELVSEWMNQHVECPELEDALLAHPLYEYLTRPDDEGHARGGHRGDLIQWLPGIPTVAMLYPPEFLPHDPDAPQVNRDRDLYAAMVADLLQELETCYDLVEIEVGLRFGDDPLPWMDEDLQEAEQEPSGSGLLP